MELQQSGSSEYYLDPLNPRGPPIICRSRSSPYIDPLLAGYSPFEVLPSEMAHTDEEILAALIAANSIRPSSSHPSCSCAMMSAELGGCVGVDLSIHGIKRLSMVDASIILLIPATYSFAEYCICSC